MTTRKERARLDVLVFERGLAASREKAQSMILAGEVLVNGVAAAKAGQAVMRDAMIQVNSRMQKYVSRGGFKLEGALRDFSLEVAGRICLDLGSSNGGFTDCLLLLASVSQKSLKSIERLRPTQTVRCHHAQANC